MEFRLGNQQRHSLVAVAMIAAATLIGLVLLDQRGADQQDPLAGLTETVETVVLGPRSTDDEDGPGRSSSRFGVADEVDVDDDATKTLATLRRSSSTTRRATRSTSPATSTTAAPTTTTTTAPTTTTTTTTTTTAPTTTSTSSTTSTTAEKKKCRGRNPKCDDWPGPGD